MSEFNLEWFKSRVESVTDEIIAKKIEEIFNVKKEEEFSIKKCKLVNNVLTVIDSNNVTYVKQNASVEDFNKLEGVMTKQQFLEILHGGSSEALRVFNEKTREAEILKGIEVLRNCPDFVFEGSSVKLAITDRTIPALLLEKFAEIVNRVKYYKGFGFTPECLEEDEEYVAHKRFFMWCCLNPRAEVASELYRFLSENSFRITKQGFFVALRNVVTVHGSPELVHFVSNTYNKVKAVWKKNPNDYTVFLQNGEYKLVHKDNLYKEETFHTTECDLCEGEGGWENYDEWEDCENCDGTGEVAQYEYTETTPIDHGEAIGNLVELYLDLPNRAENRFTDDWTKTFDIRVGRVVNMPMEECNWSTQDCAAAGLKCVASL